MHSGAFLATTPQGLRAMIRQPGGIREAPLLPSDSRQSDAMQLAFPTALRMVRQLHDCCPRPVSDVRTQAREVPVEVVLVSRTAVAQPQAYNERSCGTHAAIGLFITVSQSDLKTQRRACAKVAPWSHDRHPRFASISASEIIVHMHAHLEHAVNQRTLGARASALR